LWIKGLFARMSSTDLKISAAVIFMILSPVL
jgi:hypothetical protein